VVSIPKAAVWVCGIALSVVFVFAGFSKLAGPSAMRWAERFAAWGYPENAGDVIGMLEILCGFGVLVPRLRRGAAAVMIVLMIGALGTHAVNAEFPRLFPPLVLGGLALVMYSAGARPRRE
jgi:putative oxidoreductase